MLVIIAIFYSQSQQDFKVDDDNVSRTYRQLIISVINILNCYIWLLFDPLLRGESLEFNVVEDYNFDYNYQYTHLLENSISSEVA